ncbi:M48 family peptidase [Peribacillus cavernae]|uniref:M48 family peptidase n=1 Tax=Peribacillus cavernae TaxID=1674310 RepID=A0A433HNT1_9BACI|nr:M48 family metallopeptidase [Peribacillus cavernae]MDQ0217582.1 Zn-dependent protease with chaperone function [Peribacillus cavernae]RUQ29985.1 M48 family peptidase [Peribacillus cavernae]
MARKWASAAVMLYLVIAAFMYWYIFNGADPQVPTVLKGTAADPATFLNARELMLSEKYSGIRNFLYFISTPYEWLFYFLILLVGLSRAIERWANSVSRWRVLQTAVYLFWLSLLSYIVLFPFNYIGYALGKSYNITTQTFTSWMKDEVIAFWINFGTMVVIVSVLYWLMKKSSKNWWLHAWLLSIPFTLFMMFVQPVLIDPLYNDFYPLKNKELEAKILEMANRADISAEHVYEVNMAEKTNSLNAYVTGIGSNSRIVLWDTTLNRLKDNEILFIMAHEMAHYVEKHIYFGMAAYLLLTFIGLWITARSMDYIVRCWGDVLKIPSVSSIGSLPLFLLITAVLLFASEPLSNSLSRYQETRADKYAIEMTGDSKAAVRTFQELTRSGLSQVNPPSLVKWFRYSHPTMLERISMVENYRPGTIGKSE